MNGLNELTAATINVNLEVLKGCKNTRCISWGKTCKQDGTLEEMTDTVLDRVLGELAEFPVTNIALYGLGESLYHSNLGDCIQKVRAVLPAVRLHLNTDAHMMIAGVRVPSVDYFNICHKKDILFPPFVNYEAANKVTHIFIVESITMALLRQIDEYIDQTIALHPQQHYMIGSLWDCDFGTSPTKGKIQPLAVEDGVPFVPSTPEKACYKKRKVYISADGVVKKCLFSQTVYADIRSLLTNYDRSECETCGMGAWKYLIDLKKGGDENEVDTANQGV